VLGYAAPRQPSIARPPRPPFVRIILFGLLLFPLTVLVGYPVASALPYGWLANAQVGVPTTRPGQYGGSAAFHIIASGTGRGRSMKMTSAYVVYSGAERPGQMDVDLRAMSYRLGLYGYEHLPPRPLTHAAILDYISRGGFDPASAEASHIASQIFSELRMLATAPGSADNTRQPSGGVRSLWHSMDGQSFIDFGEFGYLIWLPWYTPWCVPLWLLAWVAMGKWLLRRHRRRLATAPYRRAGNP
jgi:hypothetical protein